MSMRDRPRDRRSFRADDAASNRSHWRRRFSPVALCRGLVGAVLALSLAGALMPFDGSSAVAQSRPGPAGGADAGDAMPETGSSPAGTSVPRAPTPLPSPALQRRQRIAAAETWRYQLRRIDIAEIAASDADLVVIDYAPDRVYGVELPFTRADVATMRRKPGGGSKIVLAYLSIGEAERYRTYWNNAWYDAPTRPPWLLKANPQWDGNFPVRFWQSQWQEIVFGRPEAYLDRILAAGFDGVYLDRADVYQELEKENPGAEDDMAKFIVALARHARQLKPEVLVVMQNAEELVRRRAVRQAIDGLAKEDLLYGVNHDEAPNPPDMVRDTLADLALARDSGLKVLVVEYLSRAADASRATARIKAGGHVPLIAERSLGTLDFVPEPAPVPGASPGEVNGGARQQRER